MNRRFGRTCHLHLQGQNSVEIGTGVYPPGIGWPGYNLRHWVPLSSPPTTRRATVQIFGPASTQDSKPRLSSSLHTSYSKYLAMAQHFFNYCAYICCLGEVFAVPFPSNERIFYLNYSGSQSPCHNIFSCLFSSNTLESIGVGSCKCSCVCHSFVFGNYEASVMDWS
jgi:hypothetical protein